MNARADNSQSDAVSNKSSGGKVTFCARASAKKKRLWAGTVRNVKFSQEVDFIFNWPPNFKPSVCCASCRKPHIFSLQVVNISARLETISTTNWPVMPLRFIYFFRSTSVKFRPFSDRCKLQLRNAVRTKIHSGFGLRTSVFPKISALPQISANIQGHIIK